MDPLPILILIAIPIWLGLIVFILRTERRNGHVHRTRRPIP